MCFLARFGRDSLVNMSTKKKQAALWGASALLFSPDNNNVTPRVCPVRDREVQEVPGDKKVEVAEEWQVRELMRERSSASSTSSSSNVGLRADWTLQWLTIASRDTSGIMTQDGPELAGKHANFGRYLYNTTHRCLWHEVRAVTSALTVDWVS